MNENEDEKESRENEIAPDKEQQVEASVPVEEKAAPAPSAGGEAAEENKEAAKAKPRSRSRRRPRRKPRPKPREGDAAGTTETTGTDETPAETPAAAAVAKPEAKSGGRKKKAADPGKDPAAKEQNGPRVKLLINAEEPEECRIALVEDGRIESFHVNTVVREQTKNNIYKGRITAVELNLQAAFVDIGTGKNGFLPFNEIHPEYFDIDTEQAVTTNWRDLDIRKVLHKGQEVLVQVVKEVTGNKGASMTTYLSLPGRSLVLMPGSDSAGISRKLEGEEQRNQLREMMDSFKLPDGIGYIIRTASKDITKTALGKDLRYLLRLWEDVKKRGQTMQAPCLIYQDQDIIAKFLRDHFTPEIEEILVDSQEAYEQVNNFLALLPPKQRRTKVQLHKGARPLFNHYDLEEQIEQIYQPVVPLPSGGSIVINPTEALVAIDVNSGRTSKDKNFSETIFLVNMEAAAELARQLRLRDLGGLIVVDFIDMRNQRHIREVEKKVKASMKRDKAKVDISRISKFGLMQISRQKMGAPIQMGSYRFCEHCQGRGMIRSVETQALYYLRQIQTGINRKKVVRVECCLPMEVAQYLLNQKRNELVEMERKSRVEIRVIADPGMNPADQRIDFIKE
ncbi:MAG: Rne/Rng family ribonuclease [Desulfobacterales bacterium]|nr:Rne/Rng family ribonuclease [Desulfobacterales bacterium]